MEKKMKKIYLLTALLFIMTGCSTKTAHYALYSTKDETKNELSSTK